MENRFDLHASAWDEKEYRLRLAADVAESINKAANINPEMDLLDLGCGTGLISLRFAPMARSLTGVDNSGGMLKVFMEKASSAGLENVRGLSLDLDGGDPLPGSYDLIMSSMTFHHLKNIPSVLQILHNGLKPGGQLCIADLDPDDGLFHSDNAGVVHFGFKRKDMMTWLLEAGFANVNATTATTVSKPGNDGLEREFSVFLVSGTK